MQLYKLREEFEDLMMMTDEDWVLPDEVLEKLDENEDAIETKAENICIMINGYENQIDNLDKEVKRLQDYKKAVVRNKDSLKQYLDYNLKSLKKDKIEAGTFRLSFRKSQAVEIDEWVLLDDKYLVTTTTIKPDKNALKTDLKAWEEIEWARLITKENLTIK